MNNLICFQRELSLKYFTLKMLRNCWKLLNEPGSFFLILMMANCQPVMSVIITNLFPAVICFPLLLTQWKGLDSVWVPYKLKNRHPGIMQFCFLFLQMLMFCGYSVEQVAGFLGAMGSGRNFGENPTEKENRDWIRLWIYE